jgi:putative membrane protein
MIVRPHPSFFEKTFAIHGSIVITILPKIVYAGLIGLLAAYIHPKADEDAAFNFTPFTALGVAISLFLGFRNNACYDRWWEGRRQWGAQVIVTRNLARVCLTFLGDDFATADTLKDTAERRDSPAKVVSRLGVAHSHALRGQLRKTWTTGLSNISLEYSTEAALEAQKFIPKEHCDAVSRCANQADAILRLAAARLRECLDDPACSLDSIGAAAISNELNGLSSVQGACERLATALVPFPYSLLVHRTITLYVSLAPFAMASDLGYYTVLFNCIVAYTFFGLDEVARLLEQPFGDEPLCLSMAAICRTIDTSVAEAFGDDVRPALVPDSKHCLM